MEIKQHNEFSRINEFNTSQTNDNLKTVVHYYWGIIHLNEAIVRITQLNINLQKKKKKEREKN